MLTCHKLETHEAVALTEELSWFHFDVTHHKYGDTLWKQPK